MRRVLADSLCRAAKDLLSGESEPGSDRPVQLGEVVVRAHIGCITDLRLGHSEHGALRSDTDRGGKRDTRATSHYGGSADISTTRRLLMRNDPRRRTGDTVNHRNVGLAKPAHRPVELKLVFEEIKRGELAGLCVQHELCEASAQGYEEF
jgi:hypothetical protein